MSNSEHLLRLVAMKLLWPRGPGPGLYRTELHLNDAIERTLNKYGLLVVQDVAEATDAYNKKWSEIDAHSYSPVKRAPAVREVEKSTFSFEAWCPVCGPQVNVDEDECCLMCGCTAMGEGATNALALLRDAIQCVCVQGIVSQKDSTECAKCGKRLRSTLPR